MSNETTEKENDINILSNIEKFKTNMQLMAQNDLINFVRTQIEKVNLGSTLKNKVIEEILYKLNNEEENIPMGSLISLLDILGGQENQVAIGLLNILKESQKTIVNIPLNPTENKNLPYTADQMQKAVKALEMLESIKNMKKTEFSEEELKNEN